MRTSNDPGVKKKYGNKTPRKKSSQDLFPQDVCRETAHSHNSHPSAAAVAVEDAPSISVLKHAPHSSVQPSTTTVHPSMEEEIRRRAYELYEERGRLHGFEQEDWARAEAEIRSKYQQEKSA